ncbi:MAG TPA: hypothetical protein VJB98_02165 [Candidatus Paceibacterota bacterium]
MKRRDLKAAMLLRNVRSGKDAQVAYGRDGRTILPAHRDFVQVEYVNFGPWRRGRLRRTTWSLANVRRLSARELKAFVSMLDRLRKQMRLAG